MSGGATTRCRVPHTLPFMAKVWWKTVLAFERDLKGANLERIQVMREWAQEEESSADQRGMGRNPKARRHFRQMRVAAEEELARRNALA